jgi:DNA-directed RNA polymerase specialized sigma24 family protein
MDDQERGRPLAAAALLEVAQAAAGQANPERMLEALAGSGFLDGLVRRLEHKWGAKLPRIEIDDCVANAVDSAYAAVRSGRSVQNLGAWLWKAANNMADDRWRSDYRLRHGSTEAVPDLADDAIPDVERRTRDDLAEHRRAEAIRWARQLLPRIGQGQIVAVMELVVDAVERGLPDMPAAAIAEAIGISADAARTLLSRGLERLKREAQRAGIEFPEDLGQIELDRDDADNVDEMEG